MRNILIGCLALVLGVLTTGIAVADDGAAPDSQASVTLDGDARLGQTLVARIDWAGLEPDPYAYFRWRADGQPIDIGMGEGFNRDTFRLNTPTYGKRITVEVSLQYGSQTFTVVSPATGPVGSGNLEVQAYLRADTTYTGDPVYAVPWTAAQSATYAYEWFADGRPVPGATTNPFLPPRELVGKKLSARVRASAAGWIPGTVSTAEGTPLTPGWLPSGTHIDGVAEVGETVSAGFNDFGDAEKIEYRWSVEGRTLGNAVTLELGPEAAGKTLRLTSTVTLRKKATSFIDEVVVSASTRRTPAPRISGSAVVGWTLTAQVDPWNPRPVRESLQWWRTRGGVTDYIDGAVGNTYRLTKDDLGATISVERIAEMPPLGHLTTAMSAATKPVAFNVYTTPGEHSVSGRQWRTACEPYSQTSRCRTEIRATRIVRAGNTWRQENGWVFNNLTYLPSARQLWKGNPLGTPGTFRSAGRSWETKCDTAATGRNACRTYLHTLVVSASPRPGGGFTYSEKPQWVFNNMVYFG